MVDEESLQRAEAAMVGRSKRKRAERISLCSNGSLIHKVDDALFDALDLLVITRYPDSRCSESNLRMAEKKCKEFGVKFNLIVANTFRLMQVDAPIQSSDLRRRIFESCSIANTWNCHTVYQGRFFLCSRLCSRRPV